AGAVEHHVRVRAQLLHQPPILFRADAGRRSAHGRSTVHGGDHVDCQMRTGHQRVRPVDVVAPSPFARAKYVVRSTTIGLSAVTRMDTFVSGACWFTSSVMRLVGPTLKRCGGGASPSCGRYST